MRNLTWASGVVAVLILVGCDMPRGPRLSMTTAPGRATEQSDVSRSPAPAQPEQPPLRASAKGAVANRYHGHSLEQWAEKLSDSDPKVVSRAGHALHVLGSPGRPYLIQGLESPYPETRRLCLENLSVSDLKAQGERGRETLVKLAGDIHDMRIRQKATQYLEQWNGAIPSPP